MMDQMSEGRDHGRDREERGTRYEFNPAARSEGSPAGFNQLLSDLGRVDLFA
jgi:hypothetical protein